ncbi:hypothetical protein HDU83_009302 [Entophlyctis luteolus]|nr:hypothetical protein HDU83_009302 [Entophlyctis luteolus]
MDEIVRDTRCNEAGSKRNDSSETFKHPDETARAPIAPTALLDLAPSVEIVATNPTLGARHASGAAQFQSQPQHGTASPSHENRLKSRSAPVFPFPSHQCKNQSTPVLLFPQCSKSHNGIRGTIAKGKSKYDPKTSARALRISPVEADAQNLRRELETWTGDIHVVTPKENAREHTSPPSFSREPIALKVRCPSLFGDGAGFAPSTLLANAHIQTAFVQVMKACAPLVSYERETISLPDGATLNLDWYPRTPLHDSRAHDPTPIVLLVHGLNGSSQESYVRILAHAASHMRGYRVAAMNYRGCGGGVLTTAAAFDGSGGEADLAAVVAHIRRERAARAKIVAVGWSLGANMVLNLLSVYNREPIRDIAGAIAFSPTFDISQSIDLCSTQSAGMYSSAFALGLQVYMYQNWSVLNSVCDARRVFQPTDLRDLAECLSALGRDSNASTSQISNGDRIFAEAANRLKSHIGAINVPTLILGSRDDPVTKPHWAPLGEICRNPNIVFATTASGGHIGWFEGTVRPSSWSTRVALEWIDFVLLH